MKKTRKCPLNAFLPSNAVRRCSCRSIAMQMYCFVALVSCCLYRSCFSVIWIASYPKICVSSTKIINVWAIEFKSMYGQFNHLYVYEELSNCSSFYSWRFLMMCFLSESVHPDVCTDQLFAFWSNCIPLWQMKWFLYLLSWLYVLLSFSLFDVLKWSFYRAFEYFFSMHSKFKWWLIAMRKFELFFM
jgi:hypothetical protein